MSYPTVVWKSRFRPGLGRLARRVAPFWTDASGFALALALGWTASWLVFGRFKAIGVFPILLGTFALLLGALTAGVYRWVTRQGGRRMRRALGLTFLFVGLSFVALHFVRHSPRRFAFLGTAPVAFEIKPSIPTSSEAIYTFRADYPTLVAKACRELDGGGYKILERKDDFEADRSYFVEYPGSSWLVGDGVWISKGRAMGQKFMIDWDRLDFRKEPGWVTVGVSQPEILPFWLKFFVP